LHKFLKHKTLKEFFILRMIMSKISELEFQYLQA